MTEINDLIEKYSKLPKIVINKLYPYYRNDDDMEQIGLIGLWNATRTYDKSMDVKFVTYASRCIRNAINAELDFQKAEKRQLNNDGFCISLDQPINQLTGDATLADIIADDVLHFPLIDAMELYEGRTREHRQIIDLKVHGYKTNEIAKHMKVSEQTVRRVWNKLKEEVKECI